MSSPFPLVVAGFGHRHSLLPVKHLVGHHLGCAAMLLGEARRLRHLVVALRAVAPHLLRRTNLRRCAR
jgi:hypothetical protein